MKAGYFATAGYTETGGLPAFLAKIPGIEWVRLFPAVDKLRRGDPAPRADHSGTTGSGLVDRMCRRLEMFPDDCDAYVLIDDGDCRFCAPDGSSERWATDLRARVRAIAKREVAFVALIAAQEVESWLLADWDATFGSEYPSFQHDLHRAILASCGPDLEAYGCPARPDGACSRKASAEIAEHVATAPGNTTNRRYSKRIDGAAMLKRADPARVARKLTKGFGPAHQQLLRLAAGGARAGDER